MDDRNHLLKLVDINKTFITGDTKIKALQKVDLTICKGEIVAIMGSSGSGKTTLLNVIGALTKPEAGEMYIEGRLESRYHKEPFASRFRRENIGFVFQDFNLLEELTVEENVSLPLLLQKVAEEKVIPIVEDKLRLVGLLERKKDYPNMLSGGQRQRVAIARALVVQPKLILADEPTGNLDYNTSMEIMNILKNMNELENQTIMVVTHDPLVASYASRVLFFHDGIIINEHICKEDHDNIDEILIVFQSQYQNKKRV